MYRVPLTVDLELVEDGSNSISKMDSTINVILYILEVMKHRSDLRLEFQPSSGSCQTFMDILLITKNKEPMQKNDHWNFIAGKRSCSCTDTGGGAHSPEGFKR